MIPFQTTPSFLDIVCGACKTGKLQPLFSVRAPRTPKAKAGSNLAADKARGTCLSLSSPSCRTDPSRTYKTRAQDFPRTIAHVDSDVELLANTVGGLRIEE